MLRFGAVFVLWAGAFAQERSLPDPDILKWQAEAQARERAVNRRVDNQLEKTVKPVPKIKQSPRRPEPRRDPHANSRSV